MEVERKFLLLDAPQFLMNKKGDLIKQGYIDFDPEIRTRSISKKYFLTVKSDGALVRNEWEVEIPLWVFNTLWEKTKGKRIEKIRHIIPYKGWRIELDIYKKNYDGLIILECEFSDEIEALSFQLPSWANTAIEITNDPQYKNKSLAKRKM